MICLEPLCSATHDVVITIERDGFLAHYPACGAHIEAVAGLLRAQNGLAGPAKLVAIDARTLELDP